MNCTHCDLELPNDAAFCSQCGDPTGYPPICPPATPVYQRTGAGSGLLIGCVCVGGALILLLMFCLLIAFAFSGSGAGGSSGGVRCCGVMPQIVVPAEGGEVQVAGGSRRIAEEFSAFVYASPC
jgi:hypothetical protein